MATKNTMSDRNLVTKGTSSDDTPTPGFVLKELVSRLEYLFAYFYRFYLGWT